MTKKYVIYYTGVLEYGYVIITFRKPKENKISFGSMDENLKQATKFRFLFIAKICCFLLNKSDKYLRTFEIKKISKIQNNYEN